MADGTQPRTLRARPRVWLSEIIGPLLLAGGLVIAPRVLTRNEVARAYLGFLGGLALLAYAVLAWLTWRQHLRLEDGSIAGRIARQSFRIPWSHVLAAWVVDAGGEQGKTLYLGTADRVLPISFKFFEERDLWPAVQSHLDPAALEEGAYQRLPAYREAQKTHRQYTTGLEHPLRVSDPRFVSVIGWAIGAFFALCVAGSIAAGAWGAAFGFFLFAGLGAAILLGLGTTEMDTEVITRTLPLRRFSMRWEEVRTMEFDRQGSTLIFLGDGKRLVTSGPSMWRGPEAGAMYDLMTAQMELRAIPMKPTFRASFMGNKNTRVH